MLTTPATYHIRVKGHLQPEWSEWFDGLTIALGSDLLTSGSYLAQSPTTFKVYLMTNGTKNWITSPAAMDKFYFSWSAIRQVDDADLNAIPNGANIS